MSDLVKRLRSFIDVAYPKSSTQIHVAELREAADRIEELERQNKELREALDALFTDVSTGSAIRKTSFNAAAKALEGSGHV